jgi:hypothetical protein
MSQKLVVSIGFIFASVITLLLFQDKAYIASIILIALTFLKHGILPIKKEFNWYMMICTGGAIVELTLVNVGDAWSYANPQFFGLPVYMPLFWGLIGTTVINTYQELTKT